MNSWATVNGPSTFFGAAMFEGATVACKNARSGRLGSGQRNIFITWGQFREAVCFWFPQQNQRDPLIGGLEFNHSEPAAFEGISMGKPRGTTTPPGAKLLTRADKREPL